MRFGLFGRKERPESQALVQIKAWVKELSGVSDETVVSANEIICADPSCPGAETVILLMEPGRATRALKVSLAAEEVTRDDIAAAIAADHADKAS
ncbi:hypothetical protein ACFQU1_15680 [Chelatococcus sp. GCM10030263]|uniref:hypothetical protein n=1 Tax=Chelatococcus sp. GCM10030263 TaxID=3273387 RepID=UPI003622BEDA